MDGTCIAELQRELLVFSNRLDAHAVRSVEVFVFSPLELFDDNGLAGLELDSDAVVEHPLDQTCLAVEVRLVLRVGAYQNLAAHFQ
ncbi:hypothetical protein D3C80_1645420 [compost metagenome]